MCDRCPTCGQKTRVELTTSEEEVLSLLSRGYCTKEIGIRMEISARTVKSYLARIYFKLGVDPEKLHCHIRVATWWNCELFQIGLRELGMISGNELSRAA